MPVKISSMTKEGILTQQIYSKMHNIRFLTSSCLSGPGSQQPDRLLREKGGDQVKLGELSLLQGVFQQCFTNN